MVYHSEQIQDKRWGIFVDNKLVASIGCPNTCQKILKSLETRLSKKEISTSALDNKFVPYFRNMKLVVTQL